MQVMVCMYKVFVMCVRNVIKKTLWYDGQNYNKSKSL